LFLILPLASIEEFVPFSSFLLIGNKNNQLFLTTFLNFPYFAPALQFDFYDQFTSPLVVWKLSGLVLFQIVIFHSYQGSSLFLHWISSPYSVFSSGSIKPLYNHIVPSLRFLIYSGPSCLWYISRLEIFQCQYHQS